LASVKNVEEALLAADAGADIIDCKDPNNGALGALPVDVVTAIRKAVPSDVPVSAAAGDSSGELDATIARMTAFAQTGIDFVKIAIEPGRAGWATINTISEMPASRMKLVAVLIADDELALDLVAGCAAAGFSGVMLDTVRKTSYSLPTLWPDASLRAFIASARNKGLEAGLAGALRVHDVERLMLLNPDILGFRGALCDGKDRAKALSAAAVESVRLALNACSDTVSTLSAPVIGAN
jgi:(5-formylfuran-3-yl)methyl phosphate synthase